MAQDHALSYRSVLIKDKKGRGIRTSVSLERVVWGALSEIATEQGKTIHQLVMEIDRDRDRTLNRSAAIRVYIIEYYRAASAANRR